MRWWEFFRHPSKVSSNCFKEKFVQENIGRFIFTHTQFLSILNRQGNEYQSTNESPEMFIFALILCHTKLITKFYSIKYEN